jgi:tripartite-type tricarboxylate transporter receptor subunit TctC
MIFILFGRQHLQSLYSFFYRISLVLFAVSPLFFHSSVWGQNKDTNVSSTYPNRTIKIVAPGAGSGTDITARVLAKYLSNTWKQPVIIENRPGAGGSIGINAVATAPADGYTLLANSATYAINPAVYKKLPYDAVKSLADVSMLTTTPYVLVTNSNSLYKNLADLIAASKKSNTGLTFGSAGVGSSTHLAAEYLHQAVGIKNTHIPYKSSPEVIQEVLAGRLDYFMAPFDTALTYLESGKLKSLGITSKEKLKLFPQYATIAEQGYPNFDINFWVGVWAPIDISEDILKKINQDINKAMQDPEIKSTFDKSGIQVKEMDQQQFHAFVQSEMNKYAKIVKQAGIVQQ